MSNSTTVRRRDSELSINYIKIQDRGPNVIEIFVDVYPKENKRKWNGNWTRNTFTFKCVGNNLIIIHAFPLGFRYEATFMCSSPTRAITRDERLQEALLHNPTYITATCLHLCRPLRSL